jgi:hypothetical protein
MPELPADVLEYLTAGDGLGIRAVEAKYPGIRTKLKSPEIRAALFRYLASDEAWQAAHPGALIGAIGVVRDGAVAAEIPFVRPLLLHPEGKVRLQAYEFLMAVYYPNHLETVLTLLPLMLLDGDDGVRAQGAQYIKGLKTPEEIRPFLDRWLALAPTRGWDKQDSFEIVQGLVKPRAK